MNPATWNRLWRWRRGGGYRRYRTGVDRVGEVQAAHLAHYLRREAGTAYGQAHGFGRLRSYRDYAARVPVVEDYEALRPWIERIASGEPKVLTAARVLLFESTSGSSGPSKWVPYTAGLKDEFQRAVGIWMHEIHRAYPQAFDGRAYWSISPPLKAPETTPGGLRVGMSSDTEYFDPVTAYVLRRVMAVPRAPTTGDAHAFYLHTCRQLLACPDLSFISVWSPNYFLQLHAFITTHLDEILAGPEFSPQRRAALRVFGWERAFPRLALLSCWTDAQAALWLPAVRERLGAVPIQPKGLLATEGVTSIPLADGAQGLAYTAHFFEFRDCDNGRIRLAHDLQVDATYEVILTTGGGLYRYATGDLVRCTGHRHLLPLLRFGGKKGEVSDLVGEKVAAAALYPFFAALKARSPDIEALFLYPEQTGHRVRYCLAVESGRVPDLAALAQEVEASLGLNPYYRQSRAAGQLLPVLARQVEPGFSAHLFRYYTRLGRLTDGDAKLPLLLPHDLAAGFFAEFSAS